MHLGPLALLLLEVKVHGIYLASGGIQYISRGQVGNCLLERLHFFSKGRSRTVTRKLTNCQSLSAFSVASVPSLDLVRI